MEILGKRAAVRGPALVANAPGAFTDQRVITRFAPDERAAVQGARRVD